MRDTALLIVDMQNDFCPGGALAVSNGDEIVPILNQYIALFQKNQLPIFASRDWHPPVTKHFKAYGGLWPSHCVQKTRGAQFHRNLNLPKSAIVLSKGMDPNKDSYSAFEAVDEKGDSFETLLQRFKIKVLFVGGLATDYCVKASACDALQLGFRVKLLTDAIKGVNIEPDDAQKAIDEMVSLGAQKIDLENGDL